MTPTPHPVLKDLVLVGGGHSHVIVLRQLGMRPMPGVRVTVIARDIDTPYSGMLPGLIAGHYTFDDVHIDLGPLCRFAGARLYHDEAVGLDPSRQVVLCRSRPPVVYDVLSIDIGVTPALSVPGAREHAVPVKPITTLVGRWEALKDRVLSSRTPVRVGVVGAGAAGVELTLAVQHALVQLRGRAPTVPEPEFHLFSATPQILPTHNRGVRRRFERVLRERGVHLHTGTPVSAVSTRGVDVGRGSVFELDEVVWATDAGAQPWPAEAGLDVDARNFILVDDTLQSTSHPGIFAAGDIAAMVNHPREKAGVFAVRQGRPLTENLKRALGGRPLRPFRPQRQFLSLISTGDRYAVGSRGRWSTEGRWVWRWKDWIDRRFMRRFRDLPEMTPEQTPNPELAGLAPPAVLREMSASAMRCGGCGSKVGATLLDRALSRLQPVVRGDVLAGLEALDDASVEEVPTGMAAVRSVDAFRAIVDDPYVFGQITATHCLSDIYAMGADPRTALAIVTVPFGPEAKMAALLEELMAGALEVLNREETALVGGHTIEGPELVFGLALSGVVDPAQLLRKTGMRPGDRLVLTKRLGTGTLFAAQMRLKAKGRWIDGAVVSMLRSSRAASRCLRDHDATACTDVTGFGLVGHLLEMTRASHVSARISLDALPLLEGAAETIGAGCLSSLHPHNARLADAVEPRDDVARLSHYAVLFDPQTAGGLLASVPADRAAGCVDALHALGDTDACLIGAVEASDGRETPIRVDR